MRTCILIGVLCLCVSVYAQNSPPVLVDDTLYARLHEVHYVDVLANDYDPDGDSLVIMIPPDFTDGIELKIDLSHYLFKGQSGWIDPIRYTVKDFNQHIREAYLHIYLENPSYDFVDANNIKARINACGNHFWDFQGEPEFYITKDGLTRALFNSLLCFGAKHNNDLYVSADRYGGHGESRFWAGPFSDIYEPDYRKKWDRVWKINRWDIQYHQAHYQDAGYIPHSRIADWPAHGDVSKGQSAIIAPFEDVNGNGVYEPMLGDYPKIKGDQAVFFVYNDDLFTDSNNYNQFQNMRLEIRGMAYAFDASHNDTLQNTLFISYEIENKSVRNYTDAYMGNFSDIHLGTGYNDYVGCDVANGAYYGYNGNPQHSGSIPHAIGIQILAGPEKDADGLDNPRLDNNNLQLCDESINGFGYGNGIVDDERLGMNSFLFLYKGVFFSAVPYEPQDYYNSLEGIWKDGTPLLYGGYGHQSSYGVVGPVTRFMFPGESDTCNYGTGGITPGISQVWNEVNIGGQPYDRNGMASCGPFSFDAGSIKHFDIAYVYARTPKVSDNPIDRLMGQMNYIKERFENDSIFDFYTGLNEEVASQKELVFNLYPNPGNDLLVVEFADGENSCEYIEVYNMHSQLVKRLQVKDVITHIPTTDLTPGFYLIKVFKGSTIGSGKWIKL